MFASNSTTSPTASPHIGSHTDHGCIGPITTDFFRDHYLTKNEPCILNADEAGTHEWRACQEWRSKEANKKETKLVHGQQQLEIDHALRFSHSSTLCSSSTTICSSSDPTTFSPASIHKQLLLAKQIIQASLAYTTTQEGSSMQEAKVALTPPQSPSRTNFDVLDTLFGSTKTKSVLVAHVFQDELGSKQPPSSSSQQTAAYGHTTQEMSMKSFLQYWRHQCDSRARGEVVMRSQLQYLKDWHLSLTHPTYHAYTTPAQFQDDWMNHDFIHPHESITTAVKPDDDFRFCYMGPQGTWTPMHSDVYNSYSWSANVVGRKLWVLFAPEWRPLLTQRGQLMSDTLKLSSHDPNDFGLNLDQLASIASSLHTPFTSTPSTLPPCYVWVQEEGEVLFVPSGWLHQVHNLDDCISINHNWMNAYNLPHMYNFLNREWAEALSAVQGFDFDSSSANSSTGSSSSKPESIDPIILSNAWVVMHSNTGMDWTEFNKFLQQHQQRFERMKLQSSQPKKDMFTLPNEVIQFSLQTIQATFQRMKEDGILSLIHSHQQGVSLPPASVNDALLPSGDLSDSSEDEFPIVRSRTRTRRQRIIRDDNDDEVNEEDDQVHITGQRDENDELTTATAQLSLSSSESSVINERPPEPTASSLELISYEVKDANGVKQAQSSSSTSFPPALPLLVSFLPSASSVIESTATGPPHIERVRGPFFIVSAHYANADSYSKEFANEADLIAGMNEYIQTSRARIYEDETNEGEEADHDGHMKLIQLLDQFELKLINYRERYETKGSTTATSSTHSPPTVDASLTNCYTLGGPVTLDGLLQYAITLGDEMIAGSHGYGWAHVHECRQTLDSSVGSCSLISLQSRRNRGPFFIVFTHPANGSSYSEEFTNEDELLGGICDYLQESRKLICTDEMTKDDEEVGEGDAEGHMQLIQLLNKFEDAWINYRERYESNLSTTLTSSTSPSHTSLTNSCTIGDESTLDDLLELAVTLGDEMISRSLGYGFTHVHECQCGHC